MNSSFICKHNKRLVILIWEWRNQSLAVILLSGRTLDTQPQGEQGGREGAVSRVPCLSGVGRGLLEVLYCLLCQTWRAWKIQVPRTHSHFSALPLSPKHRSQWQLPREEQFGSSYLPRVTGGKGRFIFLCTQPSYKTSVELYEGFQDE